MNGWKGMMLSGAVMAGMLLSGSAGATAPVESGAMREAEAGAPVEPECRVTTDCPMLPHTARWCSLEGECRYACRPGWGDANQEAVVDGCECALQNDGRELCNGVDDDCDGVIDNLPPRAGAFGCP